MLEFFYFTILTEVTRCDCSICSVVVIGMYQYEHTNLSLSVEKWCVTVLFISSKKLHEKRKLELTTMFTSACDINTE